MSNHSLAGGGVGVGIDEAAGGGVVIAALEVVKLGFGVVDIAPVAQGVMGAEGSGQGAGGGQEVAPGVVGILDHRLADTVHNGDHITLSVGDIVVGSAVIGQAHRGTEGIVEELQGVAAHGHLHQLTAVIDVAVSGGAVGTPGAHAGGVEVAVVSGPLV